MPVSPALTRVQLTQINWLAIGCFYALACILSYGLHFLPNLNKGLLPVHNVFTYGSGPLLAALITRLLFPGQPRTITVLGPHRLKTLLVVATPILLTALAGVTNRAGQNSHVYGLLLGLSGLLYGLGEEMGWRGFLQDALHPLPTGWRVVLIGLMHGAWHLTFMPDLSAIIGGSLPVIAVYGVLILVAWGLGTMVDTTKSVLVVAMAHELFTVALHPVVLAITLLVWTYALRTWPKATNVGHPA